MFKQLCLSTVGLLLFRHGPQDVPYSPGLVRIMVPLAVFVGWLLFSVALPSLAAAVMAIVNVLAVVLVAEAVLRARQLTARAPQTVVALLATNIVLSLLMIYPAALLAPHIAALAKNPDALKDGSLQLPQGPVLAIDAFNVWGLAVTAYIYKHAANMRVWGGIGLALLASLVVLMLVLLVMGLLSAL